MNIIKVKDYKTLSYLAQQMLCARIIKNPHLNLGLATGSTPIEVYQLLIKAYMNKEISFSNVKTFNLDEYVGLAKNHEQSYYQFMHENLFNHIDIRHENIHIPSGETTDLIEECETYEKKIEVQGGIDFQILGLGSNGHIAFNEPGTSFSLGTHIVQLDEDTRKANSRFFVSIDEVPTQAITMGIDTIMKSKEILLLISGESKRDAVRKLLTGEVSEQFPASILHNHNNVTVLVEENLI